MGSQPEEPADEREAIAVRVTRRRGLWAVAAALVLVIGYLAWDWNGLRFLVMLEASHVLGRPVTVGRLSVDLAGDPLLVATDVSIGERSGFSTAVPAGTVARIEARLDRDALWHGRVHVLTLALSQPRITVARDGGAWNWAFPDGVKGPTIDHLAIAGARIHVVDPARKTDIVVTLSDGKPDAAGTTPLIADAAGTDAAQPIKAHLVAGPLKALRDTGKPYPIDLDLHDGATSVTLKGSIVNPLRPTSARFAIELRGDDLAALTSLVPVSLASSRPYHLAGTARLRGSRGACRSACRHHRRERCGGHGHDGLSWRAAARQRRSCLTQRGAFRPGPLCRLGRPDERRWAGNPRYADRERRSIHHRRDGRPTARVGSRRHQSRYRISSPASPSTRDSST